MSYLAEETIDKVRSLNDIVEVIEQYVSLKEKGRNFVGLCPFHSEKTPSFTVNREKQIFYCFGCGVGGNVFTFLMKYENMEFPEAVKYLANRVGVSIDYSNLPFKKKKNDLKERLFEMNFLAAKFFYQQLPHSDIAIDYLKKRGINNELRKKFIIGYAPNKWDVLLDFLISNNYTLEEISKSGLIVNKDNSKKQYDRFRHRVIFPIVDIRGKFIGFGGRVLDKSEPKYLNSPETNIFQKKHNLYGLKLAIPEIRRTGKAIIMEGYMDVISAHNFGFTNVVASLGTSFTVEHAHLLSKYTKEVILAFDSDAAGIQATLRCLDILEGIEGLTTKILQMTNSKDPDEFLKQYGDNEFKKLIDLSLSNIEFKLWLSLKKHNLNSIADKVEIVKDIMPTLLIIKNNIEFAESIKLISKKLDINESSIYQEVKKIRRFNKPKNSLYLRDKSKDLTHNIDRGIFQNINISPNNKNKVEFNILQLALSQPELVFLFEKELNYKYFNNLNIVEILDMIKEYLYQNNEFSLVKFIDKLNEEQKKLVLELSSLDSFSINNKIIEDCLKSAKKNILKKLEDNKRLEIYQAEKEGNNNLVNELSLQLIDLQKKIQMLK